MVFYSHSSDETREIARRIAETANAGSVFCLSGNMGAGKTVFAQGFALGLGVTAPVTSPTFCIVNEYEGRLPFYHFDAYRVKSPDETDDACFGDYFTGNGICLVEWAENIKEIIPSGAVWIAIEKNCEKCENYREIRIEGLNG